MAKSPAEHPATLVTRFRCCGAGALLCDTHLANQKAVVEKMLANGSRIVCGYCGAEFTSYLDDVEVVPL